MHITNLNPIEIAQILSSLFFSILFFQSGIDKIIDRKGNQDFFQVHFAHSPLRGVTSILLTLLTLMELIGSTMLGYGLYYAFFHRTTLWIFYGFVVLAITLIALFAGQRLAKDYIGAADLIPYFILIMLGIMSMY